jgi:hypothetical protein
MSVSRVSSLFAATVLAAGLSVMVTPSAFADGVQDCVSGAEGAGLKAPDAGLACGYAHGGDGQDCASMVEHDATPATTSDEAAADTCSQAVPPPAPAAH